MVEDDGVRVTEDRFARLRLLPNYNQRRVRSSVALVVGCGALGNEVLKNLALLGIGGIYLCDFDTVEMSNLTRSVLFRPEDCGRRKVDVAARRVQELYSDVRVHVRHCDIRHAIGRGVFRRADVILSCLDNEPARITVNRLALESGRPWIDAGIWALDAELRTFAPGEGACYECFRQDTGVRRNCLGLVIEQERRGHVPTTPLSAAIAGAWQVQEALQVLHGRSVTPGGRWFYSAERLGLTASTMPRDPDCPRHTEPDPVGEVPGLSAESSTVRDALQLAAAELGGRWWLKYREKYVTYLTCRRCSARRALFRPARCVSEADAVCDVCRTGMQPEYVAHIGEESPLADMTFAQVGVPRLEVVTLTNGPDNLNLELTGDLESEWPFQEVQERRTLGVRGEPA